MGSRATSGTWMVCFRLIEHVGSDERAGSFQMFVEGRSAKHAVERCGARLRTLRRTTTLFDERCSIYLDHAIAVRGPLTMPVLANYAIALPNGMTLYNPLPEQPDANAFAAYGPPETPRGKSEQPFLTFRHRRRTAD
jgi:hypothetical protein